MSNFDYVGPCKIDCPLKCDVPAGKTLTPVPRPRHAWADVIVCPNTEEGCDRAFIIPPPETTPPK